MTIRQYGTDGRMEVCRRLLAEDERAGKTCPSPILLLPIPSVGEKGYVRDSRILLSDLLAGAPEGALIFGYGLPEGVGVDLAKDEEFLRENAALTALGTLGELLLRAGSAPADWKVGVVGYGRIGRELVKLLIYLGAEVTVYTTKDEVRHALGAIGISTEKVGKGGGVCDFSGLTALVNTAPARLFTAEEAETLGVFACVYDLAGHGALPPEAKAKELPALPAKLYPESAGRAVYRAILRHLDEGKTAAKPDGGDTGKTADMPPRVKKKEGKT